MVKAENVFFKVGKKVLLQPTTLSFEEGKFHVIMGANGAGKSTLLKILAGDQAPTSGHLTIGEKELLQYPKRDLARIRAVLSQHYLLQFPISVYDVVMMGRYPHYKNIPSSNDNAISEKAMTQMDVEKFRDRDYTTLSGGEAQKVQMSRVLAQIWQEGKGAPKLLFLDEPVSHLDVRYQYQLLRVAKDLCRQNTTVIAILHDLNLALSFADQLFLMKEGAIRHHLPDPMELSEAMIEDTFGVRPFILRDSGHAKPFVMFKDE